MTVLRERDGHTLWITLNRPAAMNAITPELAAEFRSCLAELDADDELLVGIVTGAGGKAFCAGGDLKAMARSDGADVRRPGQSYLAPDDMFGAVHQSRKPLLAAIDGWCLAGGFELALTCDIRIATTQSRFGMPEPRRGLLGGPGLLALSRAIPLGEALLIQLTGGQMDAARAHQIGLVQRLVPDRAALLAEAGALADEIALGAPLAVQAIRRLVRNGRNVPPEYVEYMAEPYRELIARSADRLEGPRAFAEKRAPVWKGR